MEHAHSVAGRCSFGAIALFTNEKVWVNFALYEKVALIKTG